MERVNVLEELKEPGYSVILLTSFSTDLLFFERMILRWLLENNCNYIGLFLDGSSFSNNFDKPLSQIGKSYIVKPIYGEGVFHPKIFLMLGKNKAKVLVGSGNLTPAGFITNTEIFNVIRFDKDNYDYLYIIQEVYKFFLFYNKEQKSKLINTIFRKCEEYKYLKERVYPSRNIMFLHNGEKTLQEQLVSFIPPIIKEIEIISPYFDKKLYVLNKWIEVFKPEKINILLQDKTSNFPINIVRPENTDLYSLNFQHSEYNNKRYHGKIFHFKGIEEEVVMYGSANFSRQAILESFSQGGNAEAVFVERGSKEKFDSFFQKEIKRLPINSNFQVVETEIKSKTHLLSIQFLEASREGDILTVSFLCDLSIKEAIFKNERGSITHLDNLYTITWNVANYEISPLFSFEVKSNDETLLATGWVHDYLALTDTQTMDKLSLYKTLENDPYLTDYQNVVNLVKDLLNRLFLTEQDLTDKGHGVKTLTIHNRLEANNEVGDTSQIIDDYYVNEEQMSKEVYGSIGGRNVLDELIRQLLKPFNETVIYEVDKQEEFIKQINTKAELQKKLSVEGIIRKSLYSQMRKFSRNFKEGITSEAYLSQVSEEVLITNITLYQQFIWKLYNIECDEPFFNKIDFIEELYTILNRLLQFAQTKDINHSYLKDILIPQFLSIVIAKDRFADNEDNINVIRTTKKQLGRNIYGIHKYLIPIRNDYEVYLPEVRTYLYKLDLNLSLEDIKKRIEDIFPIISLKQFLKWIENKNIKYRINEENEISLRLYTHLKLGGEFNLTLIQYLAKVLSVEKWEYKSTFKFVWINNNREHNLKKFILYYNRKKFVIKKKYIYRNDYESILSIRRNVYPSNIQDAAEKIDSSILSF